MNMNVKPKNPILNNKHFQSSSLELGNLWHFFNTKEKRTSEPAGR